MLAATVVALIALRPDWRPDVLDDVLSKDPRPWRTVIAAALTCALDGQAHPGLIASTGPRWFTGEYAPTPTPPAIADYRRAARCAHGEIEGQCALCRRRIPAEESA